MNLQSIRVWTLLPLCLLTLSVSAIFEDQAGKFDWKKQLVGCPKNVIFDRVQRGSDRILVSTEEDILSALSLNTGEIAWRRILEKRTDLEFTSIVSRSDEDYIYTLADEGRTARAWRKSDGILTWQFAVDEKRSKIGDVIASNDVILAANERRIVAYRKQNDQILSKIDFSTTSKVSKFARIGDSFAHVTLNGNKAEIRRFDGDGRLDATNSVDIPARINEKSCEIIGNRLACFHSENLVVLNLENLKIAEKSTGNTLRHVLGTNSRIIVKGGAKIQIFDLETLAEIASISTNQGSALGVTEDQEEVVEVSARNLRIYGVGNGKLTVEAELPVDASRTQPKLVFVSRKKREYEVVIVGEDCRVEMVVIDGEKKVSSWEWTREESLMRVASVEMVDLPLSESQQLIEDEFEGENVNLIGAFLRRVVVQVGQLHRWAVRTVQQVFDISATFTSRGNGIADFIDAVRSSSSASNKDGPFERDYFNLRKVIIVATLDGTVFGLDSVQGDVLWRIYLGNNFSPLRSQFGEQQLPLFVQRTTAHYQLNGMASVVFSDVFNGNGVVVSFNPINGDVVGREELKSPIRKVALLPFVDKNHIHSLLIVEKKESRVRYVPDVTDEILAGAAPVHILNIDETAKNVQGLKVDLVKRELKTVWSGNLGLTRNDRIVAVKGKAYNQKVHSQGRVLVDREVQYKYVNPNLAAVVALDTTSPHVTIVLIDTVTGQIVHTSTIPKSTGPVHFVHSENWLAYTYWSEKGRRTELGIIELYEGQSDEAPKKETFDSLIPTKKAPVVTAQSYIYAQGVEAMAVSETEQGLTTRSILLALPNGNIHEVSRRILDATRPMELTPAMREEMMIGYMPEIAVGTEEMINYNQTVYRVRGIKAAPSGLESTSLVLAYGTDLFFTRLTPSGTFDILKDDFDHVLISLVLSALVIGTYVSKKLARSSALSAQWA